MARQSTEQRRDPPSRQPAAAPGARQRPSVPGGAQDAGSRGEARPQPASRRDRPFAPGEDGERH